VLRFWPLLLLAAVASCSLPRDPEKTSGRIASTHELRVGASDSSGWVDTSGAEPKGVEPALVRGFAAQLGAKVLWSRGSETELVQALKEHRLDLVIGGFDKKTQWKSTAAVSQPWTEAADGKKHVMLAAPGENGFMLTLDRYLTQHMRASEGQSA
jgi:ABC-type amino acid transport substrate-binding protein